MAEYKNRIIGSGVESLDNILFNPRNWRVHPLNQQNALKGVLAEVGWVQEVIINKRTGHLVDGHLRCQLAAREGAKTIPVKYVDLSEEEEALVLATIDPIGAMAVTDKQKLDDLFREIQSDNEDVQKLMGEIAEKERLEYGKQEQDAEPQIDRAAELNEKWQVKTGDLWQIGEHRLLCGDSTKREDVERVMGGDKAILCHADPPYGMGKENEGIENDNLYREKLDAFQMSWWNACRSSLEDNASVYIWGNAEDLWRLWYRGLKDSERLTFRNEIVWDKASGQGMGSEDYRMYAMASERCLFYVIGEQGYNNNADNYFEGWEPIRLYLEQERKKAGWDVPAMKRAVGHSDLLRDHWTGKSQWNFPSEDVYRKLQVASNGLAFKREYDDLKREYDDLKREFYATRAPFNNTHDLMTDVWQFQTMRGEARPNHPTPKPPEMIGRIVKTSGTDYFPTLDPFCGSGTTMVACENLHRKCRAIEISPNYCSVILERMTTAFPELEIKKVD